MPQLMLKPWFLTLAFTWLVFLIVIPPKTMKYNFNNEPESSNTQKLKTNAWSWVWHGFLWPILNPLSP
uniref:ATP synthase complex subunit 8 n=1 Tax=Hyphessobrycon amapaensis TaxID=2979626 RepID=A0A977KCK5_9TELE|nr:ATP synthase F0 subunit 8 [Hyphessobrycon amapaensis]UXD78944.1 ATP synthase F0 subunit 8 [Hyphessobrycon amapaensis]